MDTLNTNLAGEIGPHEELREKVQREELVRRIAEAVPEDGDREPLRGLRLTRISRITGPVHGVAIPSFCVIAQGTKEIHLGEERYRSTPTTTCWPRSSCPSSSSRWLVHRSGHT